MKKLRLVKPEEKVCFLNGGKGEKVSYIKVDKDLNLQSLRNDVEHGAKHMEGLLKLIERTGNSLSRVVVLRGSNEESLRLGANYLAGICNEEAILRAYEYDDDDVTYEEVKRLFENEDDGFDDDDFEYDNEEEDDEDAPPVWEESAFRLPVIEMRDLQLSQGPGFSPFGNDLISLGGQKNQNTKPFWMSCRKEPVAVMIRKKEGFLGGNSYAPFLERFQNNRQLFLLLLEPKNTGTPFFDSTEEDEKEYADYWEQQILQLLLENTADVACIGDDEKQMEEYHRVVFEDLVSMHGYSLAAKFPKKEIVKKILALRNPRKAELIENVLKYVIKERRKDVSVSLTAEDFSVLTSFRFLSERKDENQKSTIEKMENELVGMENVKQQIRNIVQTMKYAKYREEMGLGRSMFHNIHLLIGAPGTAKSSVAKLLGRILFEEKLLPDNRFICINGADLKGRYVGHTAPRVKALFEQYDVIMIDEAYSLTAQHGGEMDSYGQEALAQLMIELEEHSMDKLVLFAGYGGTNVADKDNKMKEFLNGNPGLKSRINSTIFFESYRPEEMVQIVHCQAKLQKFTIAKEADEFIRKYFEKRAKSSNFGNGREARSLVENAFRYAAERVMAVPESKRTKKMLSELTAEDMKRAIDSLNEGNLMQNGKERTVCGF